MDVRENGNGEASADRARARKKQQHMKMRRVQILYYLCRNGQLEQPHYMEFSHSPNQQLRLKDVMDRLSVLRGRSMPSLFSWSCKRNYKNGYVWNDLAENDAIYPVDGAEYVLKGSDIVDGYAERFQKLQLRNRQQNPESDFHRKRKPISQNHVREEEEEENDEERGPGEKGNDSCPRTPYTRYSRGVSTEEMKGLQKPKSQNNATEITLDDGSPPSSSSTVSEKAHNSNFQRFEDSDSGAEPVLARNSVLLQLIACGSFVAKGRNVPLLKASSSAAAANARKSSSSSSSSLHKGVLCKTVTRSMMEEEDEINYVSENRRLGNLQSEEKEYFSGSIVECMTENRAAAAAEEPSLKKSSSYGEERGTQSRALEGLVTEKGEEEKSLKAKCIPRKRSSFKQQKK